MISCSQSVVLLLTDIFIFNFRHLLSDQTDPFNRAPLSMDQVVPNTQLAEEIRNWLEQRKRDKCDK